jgi:hypothetical protein
LVRVALTGNEIRPEADAGSEAGAPAVPATPMDEDMGAGAPVYTSATPTDEETGAGAQAD